MIKEIDPTYEAEPIKKKKACFVATATMGDFDHPYVVTLRRFRDEKMLSSFIGRTFITFYYRLSPPFAQVIGRSRVLRKISLYVIIKPWVVMAKKQLKH